jgi:hypothetical protein
MSSLDSLPAPPAPIGAIINEWQKKHKYLKLRTEVKIEVKIPD